MRNLIVLITLFAVGCSEFTRPSSGPLKCSVPKGWKLDYKEVSKGADFYSVNPADPSKGVLMFYTWVPPSKPEEIPMLVQQMARIFPTSVGTTNVTLAERKPAVHQFHGTACSGSFASYAFGNAADGFVQAIFMLHLDGQIWNGQFSGSPQDWTRSLELLKSLERVR